jgi:type IV pilus assembly protein PilF
MRSGTMLSALVVICTLTGCVATSSSGRPVAYHNQMGVSYLEEGNYTAALIDLSEAEKMDPDDAVLQYNMGRALTGKRRLDLAEQKFLLAIQLRKNYSEARNDLGVLYLETSRWDNAIQQFKLVKDDLFYARHDHARINLGLAYLGKGDYAAALDELSAVRSGSPRNPIVTVAIGRVLFAQGKTDQAVYEYRKALIIAPQYANAHFYLGLALMKQSRLSAAREAFKEVVKITPDSSNGRAALGYIDLLR